MADLSPTDLTLLQALLPARLLAALQQVDPPSQTITDAYAQLELRLATLIPFIPTPIVDLQLARSNPTRIVGIYLTGTVVSADLSGFTALSSQLALAGRRGNEEMSGILNRLFAALTGEIYACGGGVIKFGGNGLTAFFDANRLGADHTALACAATLAMQARMADFAAVPTSKGPFQLQLCVAVHSGNVFAAEVGDATHTELVVTGRTINRVAVALQSTTPGEILISDETLRGLTGARTEQKPAGLNLLHGLADQPAHSSARSLVGQSTPPSLDSLRTLLRQIELLRPYVPHELPNRFLGANAQGGEFRPITVLFANFYAFSKLLMLLELPALVEHDPTIVGQVLNTHYARTQQVIQRYGGSVNKVDMATFGDRLMALFGAPLAHDDDPARAVRTALDLRADLDGLNDQIVDLIRMWIENHPDQHLLLRVATMAIRQRISIATGTMFAGIVGTPQRHEYTVMGSTLNLAAHILTTAADGDVLLTSLTHRATRRLVEVQPLPALELNGFPQPIPVLRALHRRNVAERTTTILRYTTPLVGRQAEQALLREFISSALQESESAGRVVALIGDPGVGKTRMVDETLRTLNTVELSLLQIRTICRGYEQTTPYAPISRMLRQMLRLAHEADAAVQAEAVQQQLDELVPAWSRFAPLLGSLLALPLPDTELTQALTPEQCRDRLHDLIVMLCLALAHRQPLVITLDDLHWADASSLALVERLAAELPGHPLLLLLIYRATSELADPWCQHPYCHVLALRELTRAESEALLHALLNGELPSELRPVIERTHGMPLFLEETVRYLLESGVLKRNNAGTWQYARPLDSVIVPAQVEQVIVARLDRLDENILALLQVAAVIGQRFSEPLLAAVRPPGGARKRRLTALVNAALIVPDADESQGDYRFKHVLIRDVTYDSMLYARRRELHAQVAAAIEQVYAGSLDEQRVVLAQHYRQAEQPDRAFPHFLAAAHQAQARYANSEALALYEQALATAPWRESADDPPDLLVATSLYENMGDVLALSSEYVGARETYGLLLSLLERREADKHLMQRAALLRKIGSTYENQGDLDQAVQWLTRAAGAIALARPTEEVTLEHARVLSDSGWLYFRHNDLDIAQKYLEMALEHIEPYEAHDERARILNRLGGVAYQSGNLQRARHYVEQSLAASTQSGSLGDQARAFNNLAILTQYQGLIPESIRYSHQAMSINERIGNRRELAITAVNIGWALYYCEDYQQACEYLNQAIERSAEVRDLYHQMRALLNLGSVLTAMRQWEDAGRAIQRSQFIALQLHLSTEQLESRIALAELALEQGDLTTANYEYQQGETLLADLETEEYGRFQRLEAKLAHAQGDKARSIEILTANEALFKRLHNVPEANRTRKLLTEIAKQEPSTTTEPLRLDE